MRQIILDTETTGLRVEDGNRILEIAAVEMIGRKLSSADCHLHCYINPERDSEPGALGVHGLTTAFLADKPKFADIADRFLDFVKDAELIIHNAPFDVGYLNAELARLGKGKITDYVAGIVDTLAVAKDMFPGKRNSLDALCDRFEVDRSARTLHGALIDCELLAEVYLCMTRGQDSLLGEEASASSETAIATVAVAVRQEAALKVIRPSDEELQAHQAYVEVLDKSVKGQCLWHALDQPNLAQTA
ncbi:DNA polymerase III subunit epsilon [Burkholderiaceae bacterium DAT-1]|nr:DNA polymerase III subunit epsilon [Burkholderiaceae bacterium DAT-1]